MKLTKTKERLIVSIIAIISLVFFVGIHASFCESLTLESTLALEYAQTANSTYKSNDECAYEENEVIIMYYINSSTVASSSVTSVFDQSDMGDYTIENTIVLENMSSSNLIKSYALNTKAISFDIAISLVSSESDTTEEMIENFNDESWIVSVIPNYTISSTALTNDTYSSYQWALENTGQNGGTEGVDINPVETSSDKEKVVVVLDSGVDSSNEDLKNKMWVNTYSSSELDGINGYDFVDGVSGGETNDEYGHGTHCAGIIAAEANNNAGISGATLGASNIKIMSLKVLDSTGNGNLYNMYLAYQYIYQAQSLGVNIVAINFSVGSLIDASDEVDELIEAYKELMDAVGKNGAISVVAAGNDGLEINSNGEVTVTSTSDGQTTTTVKKEFPVCIDSDYMITVAATNEDDELATFSNYGSIIDIAAPGTRILSTIPDTCDYSFTATLLTDDEKSKYFRDDYTFDDQAGVGEMTYKLRYFYTDSDGNTQIGSENYGSISLTDEKYFGVDGNSLAWTFTYTEEDLENGVMPILVLTTDSFSKNTFTSLSILPETSAKTENSTVSMAYYASNDSGTYNFNYGESSVVTANTNYWTTISDEWSTAEYGNFTGDVWFIYSVDAVGTYTLYIDDLIISNEITESEYESLAKNYGYMDGTSMATPFVTAAVATASNMYEDSTALEIKNIVLACSTSFSDQSKISGGRLDLSSIKEVKSISIKNKPTKTSYEVGETLDLTGGVITVTYSSGATEDISMTDSDVEVTGFDSSVEGTQTLTVTYEGKTATFVVTVGDDVTISSIAVKTKPSKTTYTEGEELDLTGGIITVTYSDGTTEDISMSDSSVTVTGFDSSTSGTQTLTVSYGGKTTTFSVTVSDSNTGDDDDGSDDDEKTVVSITIKTKPTTTYTSGEALDLSGGVITVTYSDGTTEDISMEDSDVTVTGFNTLSLGTQTLTVSYGGKSTTLSVYVEAADSDEEDKGEDDDNTVSAASTSTNSATNATSSTESSVNTGDNIMVYVIVSIFSLVIISIASKKIDGSKEK